MSPQQKSIVAHTWKRITPFADAAVREFYDRLFEIDPTTRPLFQATDMGEQRRKLLSALALVVDGIDHLEVLSPSLEALGRRHARIGVTARHYDAVGDALLWTFAKSLGADWTSEAEAAWSNAYALLAGVMRRHAE